MNNNTEVYELYPHQFYCPKCFSKRPYSIKPVSVKIKFYFIPLFGNSADNLANVVECLACKRGFDPRILSSSNQRYIRLVGAARRQILQGSSTESIKKELADAGVKEELANKLIMLAQT